MCPCVEERSHRCERKVLPMKIRAKINGHLREDEVEPRLLLVHYLRDVAGLTGTHIGCETSLCGACTVLLNGEAVKSALCLPCRPMGAKLQPLRRSAAMTNSIHCRKAFGKSTACNAVSAPRV